MAKTVVMGAGVGSVSPVSALRKVCDASGVAFVALLRLPPRDTNWASQRIGSYRAELEFESLHNVRAAKTGTDDVTIVLSVVDAKRFEEIA